MVSFVVYDLIFLVVFTLFIILFLHKKRKNLKREGIMYLYRTKLGVEAINYIGNKYKKTLHFLKYLVVAVGYILMIGMIYLLYKSVQTYLFVPLPAELANAPPIAPLIPYFPQLFGLESFFPPFYFTYFIVALAIVAIVHEFSHGIYMKLFKIKIKSTGFAFLGPILGAFVEEDRNQFIKKKNLEQRTVLAAGVFANTLFALIFYLLLVGFFYISFAPSGYIFNSYAYSIINSNEITQINQSGNLTAVYAGNKTYFLTSDMKQQLDNNLSQIIAYEDTPAFRAMIKGAIIQLNDVKIKNQQDLQEFLQNKKPGDQVEIKTISNGVEEKYSIILGNSPSNESKAYMGIASAQSNAKGVLQKIILKFTSFKDQSTYYSPRFDGDIIIFIYNLLWWVMIINLLVALFNMLPLGILDGGRFFYLTILSVTKSEKASSIIFKITTYLIILSFASIILFWLFRFI